MSQAEGGSPRDRARTVLAADRWESAVSAGVAAGATLATCTAVDVALLARDQVTWQVLVVSGAAILGTFAIGFVFAEMRRLARCRVALDEVLRDERVYDVLLADARAERDAAVQDRQSAFAQVEVLRALAMANTVEQFAPAEDAERRAPAITAARK